MSEMIEYGPPNRPDVITIDGDDTDFPVFTDIVNEVKRPGSCGLRNLGNTCFMNSGLQCLVANPQLADHFLNQIHLQEKQEHTLTGRFCELLRCVWSGKLACMRPLDFKETLGLYHPQFQDFRQHDCQEFLALLLDSLHEQLNTAGPRLQLAQTLSGLPGLSSERGGAVAPPSSPVQRDAASAFTQTDQAISIACQADLEQKSLPCLEDYLKDTKVLNTNVQVEDEAEAMQVTVDSEKFPKADRHSHVTVLEEDPPPEEDGAMEAAGADPITELIKPNDNKEVLCVGQVTELPECKIKDVNLLSDTLDKYNQENFCVKTAFLDHTVASAAEENNIKNIKRIRIDDDLNVCHSQSKKKLNATRGECEKLPPLDLRAPPAEAVSLSQPVAAAALSPDVPALEAELVWTEYLNTNQSVIVDTFQGQFKSTVVCQDCRFVSMTFEPFMYLSVPLPHAMERQITVILVPCDGRKPTRYLLNLHKQNTVAHLKTALLQTLGEESMEMVVSEVFDNHISRILEEHTLLRYVNDTNRTIYAFEMYPAPSLDVAQALPAPEPDTKNNDVTTAAANNDAVDSTAVNNVISVSPASDAHVNLPNNTLPGAAKSSSSADVFSNMDMFSSEGGSRKRTASGQAVRDVKILNNLETERVGWENEVSWNEVFVKNDVTDAQAGLPVESDVTGVDAWQRSDNRQSAAPWVSNDAEDVTTEAGDPDVGDVNQLDSEMTSQWRSCAICLEEFQDHELMIHSVCEGSLCHTCIEMSCKHFGSTSFQCPICSLTVNPAEDFVRLSADFKPKARILRVPVMHRVDVSEGEGRLFGHPNVLYLVNHVTGDQLYQSVDRLVLCNDAYVIRLTDGQGSRCSRCMYHQHCVGCPVSRDEDVCLQPGDHLTVCFNNLSPQALDSCSDVTDHASLADQRPNKDLSIFDCLTAFTQSETLDEANPWFCPHCQKNQCARKTISVWRHPSTLVVYLKRFVYHELSSSKIDQRVTFPLEGLVLDDYVSGPDSKGLCYDLQAFVCHFGGANAGHYTAFTRHPLSGDWMYYNDESVTQRDPTEKDLETAYVLFYRRQGTKSDFPLKEFSPVSRDDDADGPLLVMDQCTSQPVGSLADQEMGCEHRQGSPQGPHSTDQHQEMDTGKPEIGFCMTDSDTFDFYN